MGFRGSGFKGSRFGGAGLMGFNFTLLFRYPKEATSEHELSRN